MKRMRRAAVWRIDLGGILGEGKSLMALLTAVSLETAIQTLKKTLCSCCVFTNL